MSANKVVLLTLPTVSEELSYKSKHESKVCSKCHVCDQKSEYDQEMMQS